MKKNILVLIMVFSMLISNCAFFGIDPSLVASSESEEVSMSSNEEEYEPDVAEPSDAETKVGEAKEAEDENTAEEETEEDAPADVPFAINPLTGLPVSDPDNLLLPPGLVSVTNFPPTARPQAGLSFSPIVFELYIGDGMTRYLALFYGDYPKSGPIADSENLEEELTEGMIEPQIGPIRSGRLPYEHVRKLYNGFIVMASAYAKVANQLRDYVNVFGSDNTTENSAMVGVDDMKMIAEENGKELGDAALDGMVFADTPPTSGMAAPSLWLYYSYKNQVFWRYNENDGSYHRWQDNADGETFIEQTDRLNGEPLTYENVVLLMVDHLVENEYIIDLDLLYVERDKALVFRDGQVHEVYWTTKSEEYEQTTGKLRPIRFIDAEGNPFPLKPGQTWIELIPTHSPIWETVDSEKYHLLVNGRSKGSGHWAVWFKMDY